jgi:signal transduction histidine kinase
VTKVTKMFGRIGKIMDPRSSLAARLGWVFGLLSIVLSILVGLYVSSISRQIVEREIGTLYADRAQHISDSVDMHIHALLNAIQLAAVVSETTKANGGLTATEPLIAMTKENLKDASWIGIVDNSGIVLTADGHKLDGAFLGDLEWFKRARAGELISGSERFAKLDSALAAGKPDDEHYYLVIAAPMKNKFKGPDAYFVVAFEMGWVERIESESAKLKTDSRPIDVFMLDSKGHRLTKVLDDPVPASRDFADGLRALANSFVTGQATGSFTTSNFLVGYARSEASTDFAGTGWTVVVREAKASAYVPAFQSALAIALTCLAMGLGITLAGAFGINYVLNGLAKITRSSDAILAGQTREFVGTDGKDEVSRISRSLALLFNKQKIANEELAELNRTLDQKVVERTREVQRLSDETRHAAITRDRLRMSRDLHDTLAHSMLAMLTQIRLIQKLMKSKPELVVEELGYAEKAAQDGLNLARNAVVDLRYFAVRDDGLGAALDRLVAKLQERMEIDVDLHVDTQVVGMAGLKAETAYRILEEALHNIEKHSDATHVQITAALDKSNPVSHVLHVNINDDGKGFDVHAAHPGHFGLVGMREQAEISGAQFNIESSTDKGTHVELKMVL